MAKLVPGAIVDYAALGGDAEFALLLVLQPALQILP
jgi:hypothetical protein